MTHLLRAVRVLMLLILCCTALLARKEGIRQTSLPANATEPSQTLSNVNSWSIWIYSNGESAVAPAGNGGGIYPRGSANVIYQDGVLWGGFVFEDGEPELRVGGQTYRQGTQPGWIDEFGDPVSPDDPRARVYRIRRNLSSVSYADLALDAAELYHEGDIAAVSGDDIAAVLDQYETDWQEWPVDLGAPFIDKNDNGVWEPGIDEPGIRDADQVIWLVVNDLDGLITEDLYGSPPIGVEQQITIWSYDLASEYGETVFRRDRLINKSAMEIHEMRIAKWCDPDVGSHSDDFNGCDTVRNIGFAYNGTESDLAHGEYGLSPAAFGYVLLQGPIVPEIGSEAIFDFSVRQGYKNIDLNAFGFFASGSSISDPPLASYDGTLQWFNMMRGYTPTNFLEYPTPWIAGSGPNAGEPTYFPLSGDPVSDPNGKWGDVDGAGDNLGDGDRRFHISTGPFTMAPGDTQEIIIAIVGGGGWSIEEGFDHRDALEQMISNATTIADDFTLDFHVPLTRVITQDSLSSTTQLFAEAIIDPQIIATEASLHFYPQSGGGVPFDLQLYDDGSNGDSLAGDGVWSISTEVPNQKFPYQADLSYSDGTETYRIDGIAEDIRMRPPPELTDWHVVWENGLQDNAVNPGERAHIAFTVHNTDTLFNINSLQIINLETTVGAQSITINELIGSGDTFSGDSLYLAVLGEAADSIDLDYMLIFDDHTVTGTITLSIIPWEPDPVWGDTLGVERIAGFPYNLVPIIADPAELTSESYLVTFQEGEDSGAVSWTLENETLNQVLLANQSVGSGPFFPHPILDGVQWRVVNNTEFPDFINFEVVANANGPLFPPVSAAATWQGFPGNGEPSDQQQVGDGKWFVHTADNGERAAYDAFIDRTTRSADNWEQIIPFDYEMRFTAAGSWAWDPFNTGGYFEVPFELWNIGLDTPNDPSDDYRMVPLIIDDDASGDYNMPVWGTRSFGSDEHTASSGEDDPYTDWLYWFNPHGNSWEEPPGDEGYQIAADSMAAGTYTGGRVEEVFARTVLVNWDGDIGDPLGHGVYNQDIPEEGTVFRISTVKPNFPGDSIRVIAVPLDIAKDTQIPVRFSLSQNYPNPFNPSTQISFQLPINSDVKLTVFNVLGQKVITLLNDHSMPAGTHDIRWEGVNDTGVSVGSGVYFYRLEAGKSFVQTRKMVLLK